MNRRDVRRCGTFLAMLLILAASPLDALGGAARNGSRLEVFAAASLADAFRDIAREVERRNPGCTIRISAAGSQQLAAQLEQGAVADVFASADQRWMDFAKERSLIADEPIEFAGNRLVVIVPRTNPARIGRLQDLTRRGVKVVVGSEAVPVGAYSRALLGNLSRASGFPPDFDRRVLANVVSEEENVKSVVGKVQLGEADAGIAYRSDVSPSVARLVRVLEVPDSLNVLAQYSIAVLRGAREPGLARAFVDFTRGPQGQDLLKRHGLLPIAR